MQFALPGGFIRFLSLTSNPLDCGCIRSGYPNSHLSRAHRHRNLMHQKTLFSFFLPKMPGKGGIYPTRFKELQI
jgi:hypothetical protein